MKEQLITFDTAKLAKERGYSDGTKKVYINYIDGSKTEYYDDYYTCNNKKGLDLSNNLWIVYEAPTQSLLQKWLREEHGYQINNNMDSQNMYHCMIYRNRDVAGPFFSYSYEEALEKGLQESLKLIK